jgi:hypothetical protein
MRPREREPDDFWGDAGRARRADPPPPIQHPGLRRPPARPPQEPQPPRERTPAPAPEQQSGVRILRPQAQPAPHSTPAVQPVLVTPDEPVAPPAPPEPVDATDKELKPDVLGVSISDGIAHLVVVEPPAQPRMDLIEELTPLWHLEPRDVFGEFAERTTETLRKLGLGSIAIARPFRYTNWTYNAAFERASLETCFLLASHRLGLRCDSVGAHHAANVIGLPPKGLSDSLRAKLRIDRSGGWNERWPALLVALAVVLERQGMTLRDAGRESWRP